MSITLYVNLKLGADMSVTMEVHYSIASFLNFSGWQPLTKMQLVLV